MQGMIIKPKHCCGYTGGMGKLVTLIGKSDKKYIRCAHCGFTRENSKADLEVLLQSGINSVIEEDRVKWFDKDIDKELEVESNEDIVKEKELT